MKTKKCGVLAQRISIILARLNQGERIDINQIVGEFDISLRSLQRDFNERLAFLDWEEFGPRYYKINRQKQGMLDEQDIQRFANFASISDLFPVIDRAFFQEKLSQSIQVRGLQYESIKHLEKEFNALKNAINQRQYVNFLYTKINGESQYRQVAPYALVNKNGIWYLIGTENDKQKTFCFTQITALKVLDEIFEPNEQLLVEIKTNDSISHGNQLSEVVVKVSAFAAPYFLRRNLLPNQELVHKTENNELILSCKNIHEFDIVPLVQYWIPHLTIISPAELQGKMVEKLSQYISNNLKK